MRPRFRELGLKVGVLETGRNNSITDVEGVKVGHVTLIKGSGKLVPGKGPVRTGVTVILPHNGNIYREKVPASYYVINGFGKPFGLIQVGELGEIETPIALTNTLNVGLVADAIIDYVIDLNPKAYTINPVVLECNDAYLNDIQGRHVRKDHVFKAIEEASNWVEEGAVGAGTGMSSFEFKSGIGTSSRIAGEYTVGVLVLSNFGRREDLTILGVPIGLLLRNYSGRGENLGNSIITVVATDASLTSLQLKRLAKRSVNGIARTGGYTYHGSGEISIAFSTAYKSGETPPKNVKPKEMSLLFKAVVEATEEAIYNSLFKAVTMKGRDDNVRYAIPLDEVKKYLKNWYSSIL